MDARSENFAQVYRHRSPESGLHLRHGRFMRDVALSVRVSHIPQKKEGGILAFGLCRDSEEGRKLNALKRGRLLLGACAIRAVQ